MLKVLIDLPEFEPASRKLEQIPGIEIIRVAQPEERPRSLPVDLIAGCDILFCTNLPENYAEMKQLKWVQISTAGFQQITGKGLEKKGIRASNALGVSDIPIAEWNIAMMINLARDLRAMIRHQEAGIWDRAAVHQREIRGLVVGIWGYGGIGRATARLAKALQMRVHVMTRNGIRSRDNNYEVPGTGDPDGILPDQAYTIDEKKTFLAALDFLILAFPLSTSTDGLIGEEDLQLLPRHAFLLNPARGKLVKEEALIRALNESWIAGAALDTHYHYPMPADHPLWKMPQVILTPHISGSTQSPHYLERVYDIFIQNLERYISGKPLLNELNAAQLENG